MVPQSSIRTLFARRQFDATSCAVSERSNLHGAGGYVHLGCTRISRVGAGICSLLHEGHNPAACRRCGQQSCFSNLWPGARPCPSMAVARRLAANKLLASMATRLLKSARAQHPLGAAKPPIPLENSSPLPKHASGLVDQTGAMDFQ